MKLTAMQRHEIEQYYRRISKQSPVHKDLQASAMFELLAILGIEWVFSDHGIKVKAGEVQ